jgi:peptidoglycan hydrolase CwlO-like protein
MSPSRSRARRSLPVALAAGFGALALAAAAAGSQAGATDQSARAQRAEVRAQQARVATQVDALQGDEHQVEAALATLDENVRGQQAALNDARHQVDVNTAQAQQAQQAMVETNAELEALQAKVVSYAVDAYITPPDEDVMRRLEAGTAQEDATKRALLEMQSGKDADVLDQLRAAHQRLDDEHRRAETARNQAEAAAAEADRALASFTDAKAQQQAFATQVRARLDERLADAAYLSRVDAGLGAAVAAEQAALVQAVARVPDPGPSQSAAGADGGGVGGSGGGGPTTTAPPSGSGSSPTTPPTAPAPVVVVSRPPLVTVRGITVNAAIGDRLRGLLDAAAAAGFRLGGYGWRDINSQIALRRQNCGASDYAIYQMPPDQCSPPTARPGLSMHERGLAVDLSVNGKFLTSRSDPAFVWLSANAGRFGFANLPSEPWHWSTTGG